jgi:hypothetical protein
VGGAEQVRRIVEAQYIVGRRLRHAKLVFCGDVTGGPLPAELITVVGLRSFELERALARHVTVFAGIGGHTAGNGSPSKKRYG